MALGAEEFTTISGRITDIIAPALAESHSTASVAGLCERSLVDDIDEYILDSRPPRLYVFGRSGAGKSSLINALAEDTVAQTQSVEPTTTEAVSHQIPLLEQNVCWEVIDSRGLFETTPADGDVSIDTVQKVRSDIGRFEPDMLLHVMTPDQVRAGADDIATIENLDESITGGLPPRFICLNKVDTYHSVDESSWPPSEDSELARNIADALRLIAKSHSVDITKTLHAGKPYRGFMFESRNVIGAIPTYTMQKPYWNVGTFRDLLFTDLSTNRLFQFARNRCQERRMRQLAQEQTKIIARKVRDLPFGANTTQSLCKIAALERYLIGLIGHFAGNRFSVNTVERYYKAVDTGDDPKKSMLNRSISVFEALTGDSIDVRERYVNYTTGVGLSAEMYFFEDRSIPPSQIYEDKIGVQ